MVSADKLKERNQRLEEEDKTYIWHPFTQMKDWIEEQPLIIEKGKGCYLIDIYGNRYLDGVSSIWVNIHGHRRPEIDRAISDQLKKISHSTLLGLSSTPAIRLGRKLVEIAPKGLKKVFYSDNGSTAVEIGLKIALQYWQQKGEKFKGKTKFISFTNAYHGDTLGSVSVGGIDLFHQIFEPLLFPTFKAEYPYCYRCSQGKGYPLCDLACLEQAREMIKAHHEEIAALIIEPLVQGAAGMIVSPPDFLRRLREICTENNILMIADEVATGFGRTGKMFACEHEGVSPDIMAVAKGITGGYLPLAATLTTDEIYQGFLGEYREKKTFFHGHSYTGNSLSCAAALASLEIFVKEKVLEKLADKIVFLTERLKKFNQLSRVGEVRQKGFMVGIELVRDKVTRQEYEFEEKIGIRVTGEARKRGLIIRPLGNVIVLMPPLSISLRELGEVVDITYESIKSITEQ
ncbi:MAG: adenosylmethionine--8-amino-7-oxononanoate transaminase [Deltaproteobacteria bacterium]|nr:MAG: adenosylmethionine--8-amino-7-oxononanoate transaminase [Deltaproteobacteria bacterium]